MRPQTKTGQAHYGVGKTHGRESEAEGRQAAKTLRSLPTVLIGREFVSDGTVLPVYKECYTSISYSSRLSLKYLSVSINVRKKGPFI